MRQIVVCGLGRFGINVTKTLCESGQTVTVITDNKTSRDRVEMVTAAGARVIEGDFRLSSTRREAGMPAAAAVLLTTSSDIENLETALEIRGEAPTVPIIMRHSEPQFGRRLEKDFGISAVLAPAVLAAPSFGEAAMAATAEACPLTNSEIALDIPRRRLRLDFIMIPLLLLVLYGSAIVIFRQSLGLNWIDSAYFTTSVVTTVGFGDFNLQQAPVWVKIFGIVLMFGGIVLVAMFASLLTLFVVSGAANQLRNEFLAARLRGHVVICGLGQVGVAIVEDLRRRNIPVVAVDPSACDELHRELRLRCPLIVGDATTPTALARAGIARARALIGCTSNDALNLEIGLTAQGVVDGCRSERSLRLVLRCFDPDLARRIHSVSDDYILLSEAQIAAPVFVQKALHFASAIPAG